ncbi:MAG: DUF4124 domain-containing protein [Marinobacter sp.]|uniref:DUF4124 domain-containing protein n=1 Tax=Marinobacter sp. TaxID=50741 RepID=UPI00299DF2D6|nr:DUF4124 domain-containing protein [Marinobacter sp.]MDX1755849.1 DUF4124 domain-containing protein [Marinobacter sp.]
MDLRTRLPGIGVLVAALAFTLPSAQAEIYQWTDDNGNVHFGDRVPAQHREEADTVGLSGRIPNQDEVQAAQNRARRIQSAAEATAESNQQRRAEQDESDTEVEPARRAYAPPRQHFPELPPLPQRATRQQREERYQQEMVRYRASMRCLAQYQNTNGSFKAEAFDRCEVVKRPKWPD